jgi:hypothetical protein
VTSKKRGQVITPMVGKTRTEEDFYEYINKTIFSKKIDNIENFCGNI